MNRFLFSFIFLLLNTTFVYSQSIQDQSSATGRQIGQTVGGMAGGAAGNFASGGNIAAATAGSEVGRQVGGVVGEQTFRAMTNDSNTSTIDLNNTTQELDEAQKSSPTGEILKETEIPLNFP